MEWLDNIVAQDDSRFFVYMVETYWVSSEPSEGSQVKVIRKGTTCFSLVSTLFVVYNKEIKKHSPCQELEEVRDILQEGNYMKNKVRYLNGDLREEVEKGNQLIVYQGLSTGKINELDDLLN